MDTPLISAVQMRVLPITLLYLPLAHSLVIPRPGDNAIASRAEIRKLARRCDWTDVILGNVFRRQTACIEDVDAQNGKVWGRGEPCMSIHSDVTG